MNSTIPVNAPALSEAPAQIATLPDRMTVAAEFLQLMDIRARVARRLAELATIIERDDPHDVVFLPKSRMRLRAVRSGGFVFDGGRHND